MPLSHATDAKGRRERMPCESVTAALSRLVAISAAASVLLASCGPIVADTGLDWCRRHGAELQELGRTVGVDYSALNDAAMDRVPAGGNQQQRETAYWIALEADARYQALCREANVRRGGDENWTAPPARTLPPAAGRP